MKAHTHTAFLLAAAIPFSASLRAPGAETLTLEELPPPPPVEGEGAGITLNFAEPTSILEFGVTLFDAEDPPPALSVELRDSSLEPLTTVAVETETLEGVAQGVFAYSGMPVRRAVIDFSLSRTSRFALDNLTIEPAPRGSEFIRGDADRTGSVDLSDAVRILRASLLGEAGMLSCPDAADADDSGTLSLLDGVYVLAFLLGGGEPPPAPFPSCGVDGSEDELVCEEQGSCASSSPAGGGGGFYIRCGRYWCWIDR